ncbi:alpha/beta hydrolase [Pseudogulbenkiania subflava]|uniref:Lysophospholipase, alpha-beta hydrolase superfamily n=1 Tax=Pseudogulbenkiania subflava DSM 22618 TaxID=1123014 RepID=A0A1Y6B4Z8_9NEIS|nr:alpha/beta hydrolase [Pseudogulbenkiania subflava]SME92426.1 Lysophospholipase, alpha-beta hydrolase superfamily [Pseudogulbenkiania subflava DSM 22618]
MQAFTLDAADGEILRGWCWLPVTAPRAVVLIVHGMGEHAARYRRFADRLAEAGYAVYAHDQRGHGERPRRRGWFAAEEGWNKVVDDVDTVRAHAAARHPGVPLLLFGHSMGSFVSRAYLLRHGQGLAGLVLSATGYRQAWLARLMRRVAGLAGRRGGMTTPSRGMSRLVFGSFNLSFLPARTTVDWLTRDPAEVDRYLADPLCGFDFTPALWQDLFGGIIALEAGEKRGRDLPHCPVLLMTGSRDPVSLGRYALRQLARRYRRAGLDDITLRVYPGGRHEMLNEINREAVTADILAWMARVGVAGRTG